MNDHPNALELIRIANETLAKDVLPGATAEQLYPLRMIANALGIAARELEAHDKNIADETRGLNLIYNEAKPAGDGGDHFDLVTRNRRFAQDIRQGQFEASATLDAQVRQHLVVTARRKLAAAYPKGLQESKK